MKYIISYLSVFIIIIFAAACSEISDEITTPQEVGIHTEGIQDQASNNFHSKLLGQDGFKDCQQCHSADLTGGTAGVSCASADCHNSSITVHKDGIKNPSSENFHGKFLADNSLNMSVCSECHGVEYAGSESSPSCQECHSGISVHKEGITTASSDNFHGKFIKANNWDLGECSECHGETYAGGLIATSCNTCHTKPGGPESCSTCHGDFNDASKVAPPKDLSDNTETTAAGVGAHTAHLVDSEIAVIKCESCHTVPSTFEAEGHIDATPGAEVTFNGSPAAGGTYDKTSLKCQNTYCHGNFEFNKEDAERSHQFAYTGDKITGNNFSPKWNKVDGTQAFCGLCHGLPPAGHISEKLSLKDCTTCHPGVVDVEGNIIDKTKHINGQINVFGN